MLQLERVWKSQRTSILHTYLWLYTGHIDNPNVISNPRMMLVAAFLFAFAAAGWTLLFTAGTARAVETLSIPISQFTPTDETSALSVYYGGDKPTIYSANITGLYGHRVPSLKEAGKYRGDFRSISPLYSKDDYLVALLIEDSLLTARNIKTGSTTNLRLWGDYSCVCAVGSSFIYVFGKGHVKRVLLEQGKFREIGDFPVSLEAEACAATTNGSVFFGGNDGTIHTFSGTSLEPGSTVSQTTVKVDDEIAGLAIYETRDASFLFVSVKAGTVEVYSTSTLDHLYSLDLSSEEVEFEGIAIYQRPVDGFLNGSLIISLDEENHGLRGIGIASLSQLNLPLYAFDPRRSASNPTPSKKCSNNGFQLPTSTCLCFAGYSGSKCNQRVCPNDCSGRGSCAYPNQCQCKKGWSGPDCSFKVIQANIETSANGGDGDDPAIWINPTNRSSSRILTTTKSEEGAGFAMFDLDGNLISRMDAGEPNNVDVIYNFKREDGRAVDLAVAACRDKDTVCLLEVTEDNLSSLIDLPVKPKFKVYGSCIYRSAITNKQYIFVNSKTSDYLQYELLPSLQITLVREFKGGNGGQVEGCVGDDQNGFVFIGEEPYGLWRYLAEPDAGNDHILVDSIEGHLTPDVEGVTLINGKTKDEGLLIVSCQGVSAYNIYKRGGNHDFVGTFTIGVGKVDKVTNTDGVAGVGTNLGLKGFTKGVLVVHDDVNSAPDGSREEGASFKIVGLEDILNTFGVVGDVNPDWDPRA